MQSQLRDDILDLISKNLTDEVLIGQIEHLAQKEGPHALQLTFKLFGDVDLPLSDCKRHWHSLLAHRKELIHSLQRPLSIITVFCDYLQHTTHYLKSPRIIETTHYEETLRKSHHDQLTGLFNRCYFDEAYSQQVALAKRYTEDFTVLFLDIDNFKDVNDIYGHQCGDLVLKRIADIITAEKRDSDIAARFGGEEFILLLTHSDNISSYVFAERLRQKVAEEEFVFSGTPFKVTISGGIASFPFNSSNPEELMEMADSAMYLSKGAGKNRISHYKEEKRRYIRVKIATEVRSKKLDFNNSPTFNGTSKDICVGGILFENDDTIPLGSLISVQIQLTSGENPVILIGYVVRVELLETGKYDIGMTTSFKELDDIVNKEIASIITAS
ncbi:MAG: diguanylate cyclase (GGDEF)-like protein [Desulforhopalus sp.]|jgi:diguanylate cyclase (GGDEF)-like protein